MKTILLTGGNRGLGFATARRLLAAGHRVVITTRSAAKSADALSRLRAVGAGEVSAREVDLASLPSVRALARDVVADGETLDVVVHNAGLLFPPPTRTKTADGIEVVLQVNAVAPMVLSEGLWPVLAAGGRIVALGSSLHEPGSRGTEVDFRFDDPFMDHGYDVQRAYKNSKLALMWVMRELDRRGRDDGRRADVLCPGFVPATAAAGSRGVRKLLLRHVLTRMPFATSLDDASAMLARLVGTDALDGGGGRYYRHGAPATPSPDARDDALALRFWTAAHAWAAGDQLPQ